MDIRQEKLQELEEAFCEWNANIEAAMSPMRPFNKCCDSCPPSAFCKRGNSERVVCKSAKPNSPDSWQSLEKSGM
jgi:hypothetical protein